MRVTVKLFASLARFLPQGGTGNEAPLDIEEDLSLQAVLDRLRLPGEHCHLVLVNGAFVEPSRRPATTLNAGDAIAVWPNVAGG